MAETISAKPQVAYTSVFLVVMALVPKAYRRLINGIGGNINEMVTGIIAAVIFVAVGVALGPTVILYMGYINATALSGVTLSNVIVLIANYAPFFYYLALALGAITVFWAAVTQASKS